MLKFPLMLAPIAAVVALTLSAPADSAQSGHPKGGAASSSAAGNATSGGGASTGSPVTGSAGIGNAPAGGGSPSSAIGNSPAGSGSAAIGNSPAGGGSPSSAIGNAGAGGGNAGNTVTTSPSAALTPGNSIGTDTPTTVTVPFGFNRAAPAYGGTPGNEPAARPDPTLPEDANDNAKARADAPLSARP